MINANHYALLAISTMLLAQPAFAVIHDDAPVVKLYKSCTQGGLPLDNCFSNTYTLTTWMNDIRKPNATRPLKVEIGPGEFKSGPGQGGGYLTIYCDPAAGYTGYTTFAGSGMQQTILNSQGSVPLTVDSCTHLAFQNFTIISGYSYPTWDGGGESRWTNMEINTPGAVWTENVCGAQRGKHYWFSSKLNFGTVDNYRGYLAACDESWFYGTEIRMKKAATGITAAQGFAIKATGAGEIHVYGGNIGAIGVETATPIIQAVDGGAVHIHGTGIDLVPNAGVNAVVLFASSGGEIHANGAAYALTQTTGSSITRISNAGGHIHAPYLWEGHAEPPSVTSVSGADMSVITNTDDNQPHLVIYSSSCPSKWYDTVNKACH